MTIALSVVIVVHDMAREAPRTITSFTRPYQRGLEATSYEIVVVDNASPEPFTVGGTPAGDVPVRVHRIDPPASASPAAAVNVGVGLARGRLVCVVVDGARMASPGLLHRALEAARIQRDPLVVTLAWHLGPDEQPRSVTAGYDQHVEDGLLAEIGWPGDGYRLFDVSTPAPSSRRGYLLPLPESSALVLSKQSIERLGGFDERFDQPGGGLVASDFLARAVETSTNDPIVLVGEGTFHQLHGPPGRLSFDELLDRYREVRGHDFAPAPYRPVVYGQVGANALQFLGRSAVLAARTERAAVRPPDR